MNIYDHSLLSSHKFGGKPEDYLRLHEFIDSSKKFYYDSNHRIALHHNLGLHLAEHIIGLTVGTIPTREIVKAHIEEDCGSFLSIHDWLDCLEVKEKPYMPFPRNEFEDEVYAFCSKRVEALHLLRTDFFTYISYRWDKEVPLIQNPYITKLSKLPIKSAPFMRYINKADYDLVASLKIPKPQTPSIYVSSNDSANYWCP